MGKGETPKVLCELHNKTLIEHSIDHIEQSRLRLKPTVVVGYGAEHIRKHLGDRVNYVEQTEQLGTGHAVKSAREVLQGKCGDLLVLYGDHPYVPPYVINELVSIHKGREAVVTIATAVVSDYEAWRGPLYDYGRVIRNEAGEVREIIEVKDAPEEIRLKKEVNVGYYCFNAPWLWNNIDNLSNNNAQREYYLTDLVGLAIAQKQKVATFTIDPIVSIGVNTPEQLATAEKLLFGENKVVE